MLHHNFSEQVCLAIRYQTSGVPRTKPATCCNVCIEHPCGLSVEFLWNQSEYDSISMVNIIEIIVFLWLIPITRGDEEFPLIRSTPLRSLLLINPKTTVITAPKYAYEAVRVEIPHFNSFCSRGLRPKFCYQHWATRSHL